MGICQLDSLENRADGSMCTCTVLRWVAEGKIPWGFWPPGGSVSADHGIWLKDGARQHAWDELEMDEEVDSEEEVSEMEELPSEEEDTKSGIKVPTSDGSDDEDEERPAIRRGNPGRFGALMIE